MTEKKSKLLGSGTSIVSIIAIIISVASFLRAPKEHSDTLTSNVIASAYGDLGTLYPLQAHLLCLAEDYNTIRVQVKEATSKKISEEAARAELLLEERAVAQKYLLITNTIMFYGIKPQK